MEEPKKTHTCPICKTTLKVVPRYPNYVCRECAARATDKEGRKLRFGNAGPDGGFMAAYADTDAMYNSHDCYIDGIPCHADEARFGGIVIEVK